MVRFCLGALGLEWTQVDSLFSFMREILTFNG